MNNNLIKELIKIHEVLISLKKEKFSFNNYSKLKIIVSKLKAMVEDPYFYLPQQLYLDVLFELENEVETLSDLRNIEEKDTHFEYHISMVLYTLNKVLKNIPNNNL